MKRILLSIPPIPFVLNLLNIKKVVDDAVKTEIISEEALVMLSTKEGRKMVEEQKGNYVHK